MDAPEEMIAVARQRTGLDDVGEETFHEGLELLDDAAAAGTFNTQGIHH